MIALVDCDSLFYLASYKLDDPEYLERKKLSGIEPETLIPLLAETAQDRLETMLNDIMLDIANDENNINVTSMELYVTKCKDSIRKKIHPEYKAGRVPNPIVNCLREMYIFRSEAMYHDSLEADDLIAIRAREMYQNEYVIVTMDKDLTQIGGFIYNFYRKPAKRNENGEKIEEYPRKGLSYINKLDAAKFLAKQVIMGDSTDNIKGLPRYGEVKASKIVEGCKSSFALRKAVINEYKKVYADDYIDQLMLNFRLVYLGEI